MTERDADPIGEIVSMIQAACRPRPDAFVRQPVVVALAGPIAVGKTTLAASLATRLALHGAVEVVGTDGFLLPTAVIVERGQLMRKGYPETYDHDRVAQFFADLAAVGVGGPLDVPTYSHVTFDVDGVRRITVPDVLLIEGINALQTPFVERCGFALYLDADAATIVQWFVERFVALTDGARTDEASFYRRFTDLGPDELRATAMQVWDHVNAPNVRDHIAPSKSAAHVVVTVDATHAIADVRKQLPS